MRIVGILSLTVFGAGVPVAFALFIASHLSHIRFDQQLRERGEGDTALTNPYMQVGVMERSCAIHSPGTLPPFPCQGLTKALAREARVEAT
jgi:hypothetical protein